MPTGRSAARAGPGRTRTAGFVYLGLLWMLALTAAGLAVVGESWTQAARRERERELIFRGEQIRQAIDRYRRVIPTRNEWPKNLEQLLEDRREDETRHHLRRRFEDPFAADGAWAEIRDAEGGLIGVHSRSGLAPLGRWPRDVARSRPAARLSDWRFVVADAIDAEAGQDAAEQARGPMPTAGASR